MTRTRRYRGDVTDKREPVWEPLVELIGDEVTGDFMWMFEVRLSTGKLIQAYKHIDTRCYVHLDRGGAAYVYEQDERYSRAPAEKVLAEVFEPLPGLFGVTARQVAVTWAALDRVQRRCRREHVSHMKYGESHVKDDSGAERAG